MKERRRYTLDNAEDFFAFNYSIKELLSENYREELQTCVYNAFYQVMMPQYGADHGAFPKDDGKAGLC